MSRSSMRVHHKNTVRDYLLANGASTLTEIATGLRVPKFIVSAALRDIRNDAAYEYVTVATYGGGYKYQIATSVGDMKEGWRNQALHMLTRAESAIASADKATLIAASPDDYAAAADIRANGLMMKAQAEAILRALASL